MSAVDSSRQTDVPPTRLLVVDDHPAVRAGLVALLEDDRTVTLLPTAAGAKHALRLAQRSPLDLALVDISLADGDGLRLCLELKRLERSPRVLLYTASVDPLLALKARLAGADGLLPKGARAGALKDEIATVMRGEAELPTFDRELLEAKGAELSPDGLALIGLRLNRIPVEGVADVLAITEDEVIARIAGLLGLLQEDSPDQ